MKLRIIKKSGLFIPQFYKKSYYGSNSWYGFCAPNVKFTKPELAMDFVKLLEKSVPAVNKSEKAEVIYSNEEVTKKE
jgi:hypothetical protein